MKTIDFDPSRLKKADQLKGKISQIMTPEEIEKLAKDGSIPHYILTNPLTGEHTYLFGSQEINDWFNYTCITKVNGEVISNLQNFPLLRSVEDYIANKGKVPEELMCMREVYRMPVEKIIAVPGIYFLCLGNKVVYIGQSTCIQHRISTHIQQRQKQFTDVFYIIVPVNFLDRYESSLIRYFRPEYNVSSKGKLRDSDVETVKELFEQDTKDYHRAEMNGTKY